MVAAAAVAAMLFVSSAASAQGIFDLFFGGNRQRTAAAQPGAALSYAEPGFGGLSSPTRITVHPAGWGGRVVAYCVRLCDGRFFPIQRHAGATPVQLCNALCPAAKTKIFTGSHSQLRKGGAFTPVTLAEIRVTRRKIATTAVAAPNWRSSSVR